MFYPILKMMIRTTHTWAYWVVGADEVDEDDIDDGDLVGGFILADAAY